MTNILEWFAAALVHDLGKTVLNNSGTWENHAQLDTKPFGSRLPASIVDKVKGHHDKVDLSSSNNPGALALTMADGFQVAMAKATERPDELRSYPAFYPYYGAIETGYNQHKVQSIISRLTAAVPSTLSIKKFLQLQVELLHYPYASYLPHLSLALHHRFTALILYFLLRDKTANVPSNTLDLAVLTVNLEPMSLFYRLRDVRIYENAVYTLRTGLFRRVFRHDAANLPGIGPENNPFEFFDQGNGMVLVYDQPQKIQQALQEIIDEQPFLRSLSLEQNQYHLTGKWEQTADGHDFYAEPDDVQITLQTTSLIAQSVLNYPGLSLDRCQVCGQPQDMLKQDPRTGDLACDVCHQHRQDREKKGKNQAVNIQQVSDDGKAKVGFVFLTLKEPLHEQAHIAAAGLLSEFMDQRMLESRVLTPTRNGLFEYLQAVQALGEFQSQLDKALQDLRGQKPNVAFALLRQPTKMVYLTHEDFYWRFLSFVNDERKKLRLPTSLKAVLCSSKTPFWSLMDGFLSYDGQDRYYDQAEGSIVMFTDSEVQSIRDLAKVAERNWRSASQLIALSRFALTRSQAELLLEIDVRDRQDKLPQNLTAGLRKALKNLDMPDDESKARTKQAKFIDYIAKMARPPKGDGKRR